MISPVTTCGADATADMATSSSSAERKEGGVSQWEDGREAGAAGGAGAAGAAGEEGGDELQVELCVDVGSPYSLVALEILLRYRHLWNVRLLLRPVLLGAILRATGNAMPSAVPARAAWLQQGMARTAAVACQCVRANTCSLSNPRISSASPIPSLSPPLFTHQLQVQQDITRTAAFAGAWLQHDMERTAAFARLPRISPPPGFGSPRFSTLRCQRPAHRPRTATVPIAPASSSSSSPSDIATPSRTDIAAPALLRHACGQAGILPAHQDALLAAAATPAVKQALTASTQAAIEGGAFGTPTLFIRPTTRPLHLPTGATLSPARPLMLFGSRPLRAARLAAGAAVARPQPPASSALKHAFYLACRAALQASTPGHMF
ncbi:unnamed protein product [Closterium sp. Naga37s-1]|nr:unnamed protein product [Closterium sp. Naga37s-1]